MTNPTNSTPSPDLDLSKLLSELERYRETIAVLRPANKEKICAILAAAGITEIVIAFDGAGDSGQIDSIEAYVSGKRAALPSETVEFACSVQGQAKPDLRVMTLREAIERLVYDALEETHSGWEINDGAYGEFILDVEARSLSLDYSERYTATEHYEHEF